MKIKNVLKENKKVRFAVILVLVLFFFCGKLEVSLFSYGNNDLAQTQDQFEFISTAYADNPYMAGVATGMEQAKDTLTKEKGSKDTSLAEWIASGAIIIVLGGIKMLCVFFVNIGAYLLNSLLSPSLYNFTSEKIIVEGWKTVRDVCNLFFLLILLFIAFCTILQIEKYHAKKTLLIFILMALLINFSKPIAIFIFDGSQLLMNFFLNKISMASGGDYSAKILDTSKLITAIDESLKGSSNFQLVAKYLFAIIFLFMFGMALLVMAIYLLIRIVALWLLIILSPFAFLFNAVPDFKKLSSDWWDALFKYSYVGPAIAFFLWLSTFLTSTNVNLTNNVTKINGNDDLATWVIASILPYFTTLVFLYASIIIANKFGIQFAGAITSRADKWMGRAVKLGGAGLLVAGTLGQYRRMKDMYEGAKRGISQRPGWRVLTKEGREEISKGRREKWEEKFAPPSISRDRKKAKEKENASQAEVDSGVARGEGWALLLASKRGTLTADQLKNPTVQKAFQQSPELRKEALENLRSKGNLHLAALLRQQTANENNDDRERQNWTSEEFARDEIVNSRNLGNVDWEKFSNFDPNFKRILAERLNNIATINPEEISRITASGRNINFILNNPEFQQIVENARESARGNRRERERERERQEPEQPRIETVSYRQPRETFRYDENGRLIE